MNPGLKQAGIPGLTTLMYAHWYECMYTKSEYVIDQMKIGKDFGQLCPAKYLVGPTCELLNIDGIIVLHNELTRNFSKQCSFNTKCY